MALDSTVWRRMPHEADEGGDPEGMAIKQWLNRNRQTVVEMDPRQLGWEPGTDIIGWRDRRNYDLSVPVIAVDGEAGLWVFDGAHRLCLAGMTGQKTKVIVLSREQYRQAWHEFADTADPMVMRTEVEPPADVGAQPQVMSQVQAPSSASQ